MRTTSWTAAVAVVTVSLLLPVGLANGQERLPWENRAPERDPYAGRSDPSRYANRTGERVPNTYSPGANEYARPPAGQTYDRPEPAYPAPREAAPRYDNRYDNRYDDRRYQQPGRPYAEPDNRGSSPPPAAPDYGRYQERSGTYSQSEIVNAGHKFFGSLSKGLAEAVEYAFRSQGRPNGYILGEDAGGAFIAGLRYGEGRLFTKFGRSRKIFWQGPSIGYDFGGEGTRTMVLVYNLRHPNEVFQRFGGVQGSAYVIGGASVQLLKNGRITLAPIRTGLGLRLGANLGYLKYTSQPTWNPF